MSDNAAYISRRKPGESEEHHALREILLIESGRSIRHNMTGAEMWQAMTDIARHALEEARRSKDTFVGVVDEYGSVWSGDPGASELIGDLMIRADGETSELHLRRRT